LIGVRAKRDQEDQTMEEKWEFAGIRDVCSSCGRTMDPGEEVVSALGLSGENLERKDFCSACWEGADLSPFFSHWRTRVPGREEKPKARVVDTRVLEDLFQRLLQEQDPAREGHLFLTAILLMQRRVLKYREMRSEGNRRVLIVGRPRSNQTFAVPDPGLDPAKMATMWEELRKLLESDAREAE
jgi:hypothetical protein